MRTRTARSNAEQKRFVEKLDDPVLRKLIEIIFSHDQLWGYPLAITDRLPIAPDGLLALYSQATLLHETSPDQSQAVLLLASFGSVEFFSRKMGHGKTAALEEAEQQLLKETEAGIVLLRQSREPVLRQWASVFASYFAGLRKDWETLIRQVEFFDAEPDTWEIQPFMASLKEEALRTIDSSNSQP